MKPKRSAIKEKYFPSYLLLVYLLLKYKKKKKTNVNIFKCANSISLAYVVVQLPILHTLPGRRFKIQLHSLYKEVLKSYGPYKEGNDLNVDAEFLKVNSKVKLVTLVEGNPKAPFSIAKTPRCSGGRYPILWIAPLYPWSLTHNAEC